MKRGALVLTMMIAATWPAEAQREVWYRTVVSAPADSEDVIFGATTDAVGDVVVVGVTTGALPAQSEPGGAFVRAYDPSGGEIWTRQFGGSVRARLMAAVVDAAGDVLVAGDVEGALPGQVPSGDPTLRDAFIRKYDASGNEIWTRQFGSSLGEQTSAVAVDAGGNAFWIGETDGTFPGFPADPSDPGDVAIRKYSAAGAEQWTRQIGTNRNDRVSGGVVDAAGNLTIAGTTFGSFVGPPALSGASAYVMKVEPNGGLLWVRQFGGEHFPEVVEVETDAAGSVYVSGTIEQSLQPSPLLPVLRRQVLRFVRKYRPDGGVAYMTRLKGPRAAAHLAVAPGGVAFVGGAAGDVFITRVAQNGSETQTGRLPGPEALDAHALALDPFGNLIVAGAADHSDRNPEEADGFVLKLNQDPSCAGIADPPEDEQGIVSKPMHLTVEPMFDEPVQGTLHTVNCTLIAPAGL